MARQPFVWIRQHTQKSQYTTTHSLGASVLQPVQHKALHRIHPAILCVGADHVLRLRLDAWVRVRWVVVECLTHKTYGYGLVR